MCLLRIVVKSFQLNYTLIIGTSKRVRETVNKSYVDRQIIHNNIYYTRPNLISFPVVVNEDFSISFYLKSAT